MSFNKKQTLLLATGLAMAFSASAQVLRTDTLVIDHENCKITDKAFPSKTGQTEAVVDYLKGNVTIGGSKTGFSVLFKTAGKQAQQERVTSLHSQYMTACPAPKK